MPRGLKAGLANQLPYFGQARFIGHPLRTGLSLPSRNTRVQWTRSTVRAYFLDVDDEKGRGNNTVYACIELGINDQLLPYSGSELNLSSRLGNCSVMGLVDVAQKN